MQSKRTWQLNSLVFVMLLTLSSVILSGCFPLRLGPRQPPGGDQTVAVTVEAQPLNSPRFGADSTPAASPTLPVPASTPDRFAVTAQGRISTADFDAQVATAWFDLLYQRVRDEKLTPPIASRLFGYAGVALYEAVVPGMPGYQSLASQLNDLSSLPQPDPQLAYHWPTVANAALATLSHTLLAGASTATARAVIDLERQLSDQFAATAPADVVPRSVAHGQRIGLAIADWAEADGIGALNNCNYTPPSGPGLWEPTPPQYAAPVQPCWGQMRPFVLRERSNQCQPTARPVYSEETDSQFYFEALDVYLTVKNLTADQQEIARFWSDDLGKTGTPPGHTISILTQIARNRQLSLDVAAEAYARLGIAVADAFISCWQTKFATNVVRPVTYIGRVIDPDWTSPLTTPPFPEYTSGHSVQVGAAAAVLTSLFGDNYEFTDDTHHDLGLVRRSFSSFSAMAEEAAISRLYGGIHYRSAIEAGLRQGACIGEQVNALEFRE